MMTTADSPVFVDTNVLVYANTEGSPWRDMARNRLVGLYGREVPLWISRQVLREYMVILSRRDVVTGRVPVEALVADIREFQDTFEVADESRQTVFDHLLSLIGSVAVGGKQIHDANIVATMLAYGVPRLLTHKLPPFLFILRENDSTSSPSRPIIDG